MNKGLRQTKNLISIHNKEIQNNFNKLSNGHRMNKTTDNTASLYITKGFLPQRINTLECTREIATYNLNSLIERSLIVYRISQRIDDIDRNKGKAIDHLDENANNFKIQTGSERNKSFNTRNAKKTFIVALISNLTWRLHQSNNS